MPEVETIRNLLEPELAGRTILRARIHKRDIILGPPGARAIGRRLAGRRIRGVARRGKYLLLELDSDLVLQVQLRMTGRFAIGRRRPDPEEFRHIAAELELDDGRTLFYDDMRRLGGFRLLDVRAWRRIERSLGPEPLDPSFTPGRLKRQLLGSRAPIKNALLDQGRLAGLGNIYASEALHRAAIDPRRLAGELGPVELKRLHRGIQSVLRAALGHAGTTFRDYRTLNGRSGEFQGLLRVYGKEGKRCARCGATILRIVQAGRSTFFCPICQR